jgi:hypothetical protein
MPRYRRTVEFDAEDDEDADAQVERAILDFKEYAAEHVSLASEEDGD